MFSTVMSPMLTKARELGTSVDGAYTQYPNSFGDITPGGTGRHRTAAVADLTCRRRSCDRGKRAGGSGSAYREGVDER